MANMIFNLDLNKNNAINPIIFGRLTDGNLRKITVNITNEGEPVDLTDWVIRFEGTTGGHAKVFDVLGVNILDAKNGKFEYTFSKTAFSASGAYRQAYFSIEKDNMRETTNDIKIVVENIADLDAQDAETVVTELNKTITLINQKYDELNGRVKKYEGDIASLEGWLLGKKTEIENIIKSANSNFNQKLSEIQEKLDKINQAIEKGSETIAYSYTPDGTDGFTVTYPNLNLLEGTRDFSGTWNFSGGWTNDGTYKGLTVKKKTIQWNGISKSFIAQEDGVYTFSAYVKSSGENANITRFCILNTFGVDLLRKGLGNNFDWTRDSLNINLKAGDEVLVRYEISGSGTDSILRTAGHKWEEGSTATLWMPSANEVTSDDYPKYVGFSNTVKTDKTASDYTWFPDLTNKVEDHVNNKSNPHGVTASQVGSYTKSEVATLISEAIKQSKLDANPVGSIITTISDTNPSTYLGGTWERFANGRTLVGVDESDSVTLMKTANNTGGSVNPLTKHSHNIRRANGTQQSAIGATISWSDLPNNGGVIQEAGDNTNHNNWQPFMTVYFWRRTA